MKPIIPKSVIALAVAVIGTALFAAAESKIGSVMKDNFKGDTSTFKSVSTGKGSDADAAKLLAAVKELPSCKPPQGDAGAWKTKTEALVKAAEDVVAKKPNSQSELAKAGNCKDCHSVFRPKKQ